MAGIFHIVWEKYQAIFLLEGCLSWGILRPVLNPIHEKLHAMTTFVGLFFSIISIFGLFKCKSKRAIKKILLVGFSIFLILAQLLFMNAALEITGQEFVALSALLSGIILILIFQKNDPEE